jgi:transcription initiation factor IIE alpha subunit
MNEQSIPCPTCQTKIPFDPHSLLQGAQFVCSNCQGVIGLATDSKPLVEETMGKFDQMRKSAGQMKNVDE